MFCRFQAAQGYIPMLQINELLQCMRDTSGVHLPHKADIDACLPPGYQLTRDSKKTNRVLDVGGLVKSILRKLMQS